MALKDFYSITVLLLVTQIGCKDKTLWNTVIAHFSSPSLSKETLKARLSNKALNAIAPKKDTLAEINTFFAQFKSQDYRIVKRGDTTYVVFNGNDVLTAGPTFEIIKGKTAWYVNDIWFGK